ncbi:MAG TPA: LacI family transcriptional regulator [Anaerolineae bacterium]|nr:LacI family transcriptional regulator [Anaerolineae bacterium]
MFIAIWDEKSIDIQNVLDYNESTPKTFLFLISAAKGTAMPVTIKDIARRTGKSITTVSRALHGYNDVSEETRAMIVRVAEEMGYMPNLLAQRLQKQRTDTLGFILPTYGPRFSDPFFSEFLAGIGNTAGEHGYDLLVSTQPPGEKELEVYRKKVMGRQVDGFIVVRTRCQDPRIDYLREVGAPFVAFGRTEGNLDYPFVDEDGAAGMKKLVAHLVGLGHQRIAYISPPLEYTFARDRLRGVQEALQEAGLALPESWLVFGDLTQGSGKARALELLQAAQRPTAIIAGNDLMAFGAMNAAMQLGLRVGRDVAIAGFDDIPMAETAHPPLTTVHQPIYKIGRMLTEMLIQIIQGKPLETRQILLTPQLIVRQSCGE